MDSAGREARTSPALGCKRSRAFLNHGAKPHTPFIIDRFVRKKEFARGGTACAGIYPLAKGLPMVSVRQARNVRAAILWQKGWRRGKNQQILPLHPLNAASSAVGTGYASMYSLANRFSTPRAGLTASAIPPFGYTLRRRCCVRHTEPMCAIDRACASMLLLASWLSISRA